MVSTEPKPIGRKTKQREQPPSGLHPHRDASGVIELLLLFGSGLASLIYQVVWIKQVALIVGVDVYAVTVGVSAFFLGLALGGWYWGRKSDRENQPLRLYAWLEIGIAVTGIAATLLLAHMARLFVALESHGGVLAWLLPIATIALPAILMGGTVPALMKARSAHSDKVARSGGILYAANTLGAAFGALLTTFVLILNLGVQGSAFAAAGVNLLLAAGAFLFAKRASKGAISSSENAASSSLSTSPKRPDASILAIWLYAIAGGIALGYEVVWSQSIVIFTSTRSFAFTIVLATYLIGLVIGSALYARFADRVKDPWGVFATLIAFAGVISFLQVATSGGWLLSAQYALAEKLRAMGAAETSIMCGRFALAALCTVFLPTLLLGAAFPAALRLCAEAGHVARDIGRVLALNTLGGIAGTFVAGFVLVPMLGIVRTMAVLAMAATIVGVVALWRGKGVGRTSIVLTGFAFVTCVVLVFLTPADNLSRLQVHARGGQIISYEESPAGAVAVLEQGRGAQTFRRLYIQGVSNSGDGIASLRYMRLQALLPLVIHNGEPRSTLVIALGTGITSGALTQYPGLEKRVTAELLPAVVRATPLFRGNYGIASDPSSEIRIRDGRHELLRSEERYDLITLEPPPPSAAGVVNLYSRDFYELARSRLNPNGLFAQWLPIATQNDEDTRSLVRSFLDVFPHASLWTTELHEMLLVGSVESQQFDARAISERFDQASVKQALSEVGIDTPAALLATYVCSREGLTKYVQNAPPVTDDRPLIEYAAWVRPNEITRTLPKLLALQNDPLVANSDYAFQSDVRRRRATLMDFYSAGLYAYSRDRDGWAAAISRVAASEPRNPYYRSIMGAD